MEILNDLAAIKKIDTEGMLELEEKFFVQLEDALKIGESCDIKEVEGKKFEGIAFTGVGGSGFAGDFIKNLIKYETDISVEVVKGYKLPNYVNSKWLVVPLSYSGNTEETISVAKAALKKGSELLFVSSGGAIEEMAAENNKCIIKIPGGLQPRAASGYLFMPLYVVLKRLGIAVFDIKQIKEAVSAIKLKSEIYCAACPADKNPAKKLALSIFNKMPVIYGYEGVMSSVAYRIKCQINENSKTPCFCSEFPELNHNETVGWQNLAFITKNFILICLQDKDESQRINTRINVTIDLVKDNFASVIKIPVEGRNIFEKALNTMYLGSVASVYLAILSNVDPTPVEKIAILKGELAKIKD